jgi:enoyl-CoA hydratase
MGVWSLDRHGRIAVLTFMRPPRNFMSFAAMGELEERLTELADDDSVSVVVLTGGVDGYFVAHADLDDLTKIGRGEPFEGDPGAWGRSLHLLETMPQPTVAAINGQAHGGGCEISLACTMRVASESAHLGQPEVVVGIIPGAGGTQRLPRLVGTGRAAELILSGRVVNGEEAHRIGLVEAVLPDDGFLGHVIAWLEPMASHPRGALAAAKRAVVEGTRLAFEEGLRLEGRLFLELQTGSEALGLQDGALETYRSGGSPGL